MSNFMSGEEGKFSLYLLLLYSLGNWSYRVVYLSQGSHQELIISYQQALRVLLYCGYFYGQTF